MGNQAVIIFENPDSTRFSPAVYLHWNGGPESVYAFLDELDYRKVGADQEYEAARFVQIIGEMFDFEEYSRMSLGIQNGPKSITGLDALYPGCNGIYLVCRANGKRRVRRFVKPQYDQPLQELDELSVERERQAAYRHEYHTGEEPISQTWRKLHPGRQAAKY